VIGLEMENYGFFHAAAHASHPRPMAFSVKSVCDFADQDKGDAFQRYAAYTSAQVVYHFADRYLFN
jgi:nucleoside phosphorylase